MRQLRTIVIQKLFDEQTWTRKWLPKEIIVTHSLEPILPNPIGVDESFFLLTDCNSARPFRQFFSMERLEDRRPSRGTIECSTDRRSHIHACIRIYPHWTKREFRNVDRQTNEPTCRISDWRLNPFVGVREQSERLERCVRNWFVLLRRISSNDEEHKNGNSPRGFSRRLTDVSVSSMCSASRARTRCVVMASLFRSRTI